MESKVALVTGAGLRIGAAIARELHSVGCHVIIHYRRSGQAAAALMAELNAQRANSASMVPGDLVDPDQVERIAADALAAYGRLDLLINNASSFYPTPIGEASWQQWQELSASNLSGPLFLSQALVPALQQSSGAIVNIVDVHTDLPLTGYSLYGAAKAGLVHLTRSLAKELGPHIRVNGVAPGAILWPADEQDAFDQQGAEQLLRQTALGRMGRPEDVAGAVRFLALEAPYITGQILAVDGGRSLY